MAQRGIPAPQLRAMEATLQQDPGFQRVLRTGNQTLINDYVINRSPVAAAYKSFLQQQRSQGGRGQKSYSYDAGTGRFEEHGLGPSHWYTDPAVIGPLAVGAATGVGAFAAAPVAAGPATMPASGIAPSLSGYGVTPGMGAAVAPSVTGTGATTVAGKGLFSSLGKYFGSAAGAATVDAAGNLIGAGLQARSNNRASDLQSQYNQQALEFLKQQDARDFAEYMKERDRDLRMQDEDRSRTMRFQDERETRLAPFRANAAQGHQTLSSLLFNPNQRMAQPAPVSGATTRRPRQLADLV